MHLSDDQLSILREQNADARYTEEAIAELVDECDDFNEVLCELADADAYCPWEWNDVGGGEGYAGDDEIPF